MQDQNHPTSDPVDAAFDGNGQSHDDADALRGRVFTQTVRMIRRRRRLKRCALAAGLLGCYLAGVTTMGMWRSDGWRALAATSRPEVATSENPSQRQPPAPLPKSAASHNIDSQRQDVPRPAMPAINHPGQPQVAVAIPTAFESWRNIGDYYLRESGDIALAAAGYSQAIDLATEEERAISPGRDNWLLMAMKDAREKEKNYARYEQN
jgi:hypothetical protein